jgi:copper homeostasis protein
MLKEMGMTLEICVDSVALAQAAVRGGADRIELCGPLEDGGVTPDSRLVAVVREAVEIPIAMLVRRRTGPFTVSEAEFEEMRQEVLFARRNGVDIVVIGILQPDGTVDVERTRQLVELAYPMQVTFHRAFDSAPDLDSGLQAVLRTGASRLLTSGGSSSAVTGAPIVSKLQGVAGDRLSLVVCGGVTPENIAVVLECSGVREVHAALRQIAAICTRASGSDSFAPFVEAVSELRRVMDVYGQAMLG